MDEHDELHQGPTADEMHDILERHIVMLREHFDTVTIFVTKHDEEDGGTHNHVAGAGNLFAREHQIEAYVKRAKIRHRMRDVAESHADMQAEQAGDEEADGE
jgi:hypothetical protein